MKLVLISALAFLLGWSSLAIWHGPGKAWLGWWFSRVQY